MNDYRKFDVLIVGASLAGSALAHQLAKTGITVGIFDKATFPRRKACGEGLSHAAIPVLTRIGLLQTLLSSNPKNLAGYAIRNNKLSANIGKLDTPLHGLGVERTLIDKALLEAATQHEEISPFIGEEITAIKPGYHYTSVQTSEGEYFGGILVLACGASGAKSLLANNGLLSKIDHKNFRIGFSYHLQVTTGTLPSHVQIFPFNGFELYLTPLSNNKLNAAILTTKSAANNLKLTKDIFRLVTAKLSQLNLVAYQIDELVGAGELGQRLLCSHLPRMLLIGDSRECFDPVGGIGMTHAFSSSEVAAKSVCGFMRLGIPWSICSASFNRILDQQSKLYRGFTRMSYAGMRVATLRGGISCISSINRAVNIPGVLTANNYQTQASSYLTRILGS